MTVSSRGIALIVGILALGLSGAAMAQENLDANKSPAQLFASDCMICHKTTQGLTRGKAASGLESFLREHYTASRESAAALAGYLRQTDRGPLPDEAKHKGSAKRGEHGKSADKGKSAEKKPAEKEKSADKKPGQAKATDKKNAGEAKTGEKKAGDNKSAEKKAADQKADKKTVVAKPASKKKPKEAQSISSKPKDAKPAE